MIPASPISLLSRMHWLNHWDPRLRILMALSSALTIVVLQQPWLLSLVLAIMVVLTVATQDSLNHLLRRLLPLEIFMLILFLSMSLTMSGGEAWRRIGPLTIYWQGMERAFVIAVKSNAIVLMFQMLTVSMEPVVIARALNALGLPGKLVQLFLFTIRYLGVVYDEYLRLRKAMKTRAFVSGHDGHSLRVFGWLAGMLLVRSLERSQRILAAMKCRGFNGRLQQLGEVTIWQSGDTAKAVLLLLILGTLLSADRFL